MSTILYDKWLEKYNTVSGLIDEMLSEGYKFDEYLYHQDILNNNSICAYLISKHSL